MVRRAGSGVPAGNWRRKRSCGEQSAARPEKASAGPASGHADNGSETVAGSCVRGRPDSSHRLWGALLCAEIEGGAACGGAEWGSDVRDQDDQRQQVAATVVGAVLCPHGLCLCRVTQRCQGYHLHATPSNGIDGLDRGPRAWQSRLDEDQTPAPPEPWPPIRCRDSGPLSELTVGRNYIMPI